LKVKFIFNTIHFQLIQWITPTAGDQLSGLGPLENCKSELAGHEHGSENLVSLFSDTPRFGDLPGASRLLTHPADDLVR